jgi:molybdopterin molybdotransferase
MKTVDAHLADVLDGVRPLPTVTPPLIDALGAVLAHDLRSQIDLPVFTNSAMDGYAVRRSDLAGASESSPVTMTVTGDVGAGTVAPAVVPGSAVRVMTGAPLPAGADAVVPVEWTDAGVAVVTISREPAPWANIRTHGEDVPRGSVVLRQGAIIDPAAIALIASIGASHVTVHRRAHVLILSTGSELVAPGSTLGPAQIFDSNSIMLASAVRQLGATFRQLSAAPDDADALLHLLLSELDGVDLVLTTGGISVGAYDVVKEALSTLGTVTFERVAMQPGKPQGHGVLGHQRVPVLTLPGNPVSAFVSFHVFVAPVLRRLHGHRDVMGPTVRARLGAPLTSPDGRRQFVRVDLATEAGERVATPVGGSGSHLVGALARANALAIVPEHVTHKATGDDIEVMVSHAHLW